MATSFREARQFRALALAAICRYDWCHFPQELEGTVRQLGEGCYGAAYLLADGRVLKVATQDGTAQYIRDIAAYCSVVGTPPPYAPMVWDYGTAVRDLPIRRWSWDERQYVDTGETRECHFWYTVMEFVHIALDVNVDDLMYKLEQRGIVDVEQPGICDLISHMQDHWGVLAGDLHDGNWGWTEYGRPVVTDPSGKSGTVPPKFRRQYHSDLLEKLK